MARLSKTTPFHIYSDNGQSTHEATQHNDLDDDTVEERERAAQPFAWAGGRKDDGFVTESDDERKAMNDDGAQEGDDEKNYTRTSISSFPESSYPTDYERAPIHKPYTPTYTRPLSRRTQMSSPLRKGKHNSPYSEPRGSPRSRRKDFDVDNDGPESKRFPLVLLHITALPVTVSWTVQSMRETLPQHALENLQLLKSKLSPTVLKRGILIPHPRDDYELLEEKLLEALELQEPRISKCGHYRGRHSTDSTSTNASTGVDSGVGSSVDGSDEEHCSTCHHHLRAAGSGKQKWSIKVFAANGLMRASAWSAAWSEMERVDVEIMPWIKDELRIKLDKLNNQELVVKETKSEDDELRINQLVEQRLRHLEEDSERAREAAMLQEIDRIVIAEQRQISQTLQETQVEQIEAARPVEHVPTSQHTSTELPNIYRPKDIPLSILLRNYIFLLARKPLNMAIFFLVVFVSGILLVVEPAAISDSVAELSALAIPKTVHKALDLASSVASIPEVKVLNIGEISAQAETNIEDEASSASKVHEIDTVIVSQLESLSQDDDAVCHEEDAQQVSGRIDELHIGDAAADAENPSLEVDGEVLAEGAVQLEQPAVQEISAPLSNIKAEIAHAPEVNELDIRGFPVTEGSDGFMALISSDAEWLGKCLPYSMPATLESSAFCELDESDTSSVVASTLSQPGLEDRCLVYTIVSTVPAVCPMNDGSNVIARDGTVF